MFPSEIPRLTTDPLPRLFPGVWKLFSFLRLPSWDRSPSLPLCLSFYLLYFVLPPFKDNGPFWVPDVLCQHSKFVLWNLLVLQMFFRWICGGESGLPFLFLHHLRTPKHFLYLTWWKKFLADVREGKQSSFALLYSVNEACVLNCKRQMNGEGRGRGTVFIYLCKTQTQRRSRVSDSKRC